MTIREAIAQIDELRPNTFSQELKVRWLSILDMRIKNDIIDTHEADNGEPPEPPRAQAVIIKPADDDTSESADTAEAEEEPEEFTGYTEGTDPDTELLVGAPYDEIYLHWLRAQIDYSYEEYKKFNNSNAMFTSALSEYVNFYNRTHKPKSAANMYF